LGLQPVVAVVDDGGGGAGAEEVVPGPFRESVALPVSIVLTKVAGRRVAMRVTISRASAGGGEASRMARSDWAVSRYFWMMNPPIEWPARVSGGGRLAAAPATAPR